MTQKNTLSDKEWREKLSDEEYRILRQKGTERAFTGTYNSHYEAGDYRCAGCGEILFDSDSKFESGCGWPAFSAPAQAQNVAEHRDNSHGMIRTEVTCSACEGHLGHVFPDGPQEKGGLRYCINSGAIKFSESE